MAAGLLVAAALLAGLDLRSIVLLSVGVFLPGVAAFLIALHLIADRKKAGSSDATFCHSVARELRSGSSLRAALESAAEPNSELHARILATESLSSLSSVFEAGLDFVGTEVASVVESVGVFGGPAATLFDEIADLALAQLEIAEDVRVASASARASALVLIGLPVAYLSFQLSSGRLALLLSRPAQQALTVVGWSMVAAGVIVGWLLIRKAVW